MEGYSEVPVLAVTRAEAKNKGPIVWEEQEKIRRKVAKKLEKRKPHILEFQDNMEPEDAQPARMPVGEAEFEDQLFVELLQTNM